MYHTLAVMDFVFLFFLFFGSFRSSDAICIATHIGQSVMSLFTQIGGPVILTNSSWEMENEFGYVLIGYFLL